MSSPLFCPNCGAANTPQDSTCHICDQSLTGLANQSPPQSSAINQHGRIVKGRYRLLTQLGVGGSGAVYRAEDTALHNKTVAVKEISLHGLLPNESREATELFHQEVQLLARLNHPNLPDIYDEFVEGESCFLVMDYVDGITLETYVEQQGQKLPRLPIAEVITIGLDLCRVLHYLHTHQPPIVFRDLKPANVMRTEHGHLYLIDFGIARLFKPGQQKDTMPFGSPGYAAPEQYGRAQTTQRSDIYSLGALLHTLLTGYDPSQNPFRFEPLPTFGIKNYNRLDLYIQRMVELKPEQRPGSIPEVQKELKAISEQDSSVHQVTGGQKQRSRKQKSSQQSQQAAPVVQSGGKQLKQKPQAAQKTPKAQPITRRRVLTGLAIAGGILLVPAAVALLQNIDDNRGSSRDAYIDTSAWSPDGKHVALGLSTGEVRVLLVQDQSEVATFNLDSEKRRYSSGPTLRWSPDSTSLALSYREREIFVWNLERRASVYTYRGHSEAYSASSIAWSLDSSMVASAKDDELHVWQSKNGSLIFHTSLAPPENKDISTTISHVSWSGSKQQIAVGIVENNYKNDEATFKFLVYNLESDLPVNTHHLITAKDQHSFLMAGSPTTPYVAVYFNEVLQLIHTELPDQKQEIKNMFHSAQQLSWSPDGRILAFVASYDTIATWTVENKAPAFYKTPFTSIESFSWLPDNKQIRMINRDEEIATLPLA